MIQESVTAAPSRTSNEGARIEVGDSVAFAFPDQPDAENWVTIISGESNPNLGLVNSGTPIARALLGATAGSERIAHLPAGARKIKILTVHPHRPAAER